MWATSVILKKQVQGSKRPLGINSPNLVTLDASSNHAREKNVAWMHA
jgi:hypothetical protein